MKINFDEYLIYVRSLDGQTLTTLAQEKPFRIIKTSTRVQFQPLSPESDGSLRTASPQQIQRVLERYEQTASLRPGDYTTITRNASYHLALIARFVAEKKSKGTK